MGTMLEIMQRGPVIPVITIDDLDQAQPLAEALITGGMQVLEVTLRTSAGLDAIRKIKDRYPEIAVGAGTVVSAIDVKNACAAGADFLVTPGTTEGLLAEVLSQEIPLLPGVSTASEVIRVLEAGLTEMKFFPAEASGGIPMLRSLGGPFGQVTFCPTGGIGPANVSAYLALGNVACVGGSWMLPGDLLAAGDWPAISELASAAVMACSPGL